jgi:pimeloyl-ACP methyl ester carboxylesterase
MTDRPVHVEIVGDGGEPIILLPGGGVRDPAYLGDVARWGAGRMVAVVHFRGTPSTGGLPRPWWDQRDDLESVRRALELDSIDVLAHSSGTRVALAYAASGAPVRRLGLITPPSTWLTGRADDIAQLAEPRRHEPAMRAALHAPPLDLSDEHAYREQQRLTAPLGYAAWNEVTLRHSQTGSTDLAALRAFFGAPPPATLMAKIAALSIPIHVIGGAADLLTGNRPVRELAGAFCDGTVEMIEGSGHYPWIDQPVVFAEAIRRWAIG